MKTSSFSDFLKIDIRVGTIMRAELNKRAEKPAYKLLIDFGDEGQKISSAQITENYTTEQLEGRQILAVVNFPAKQVANVMSECLVLGLEDKDGNIVLVTPDQKTENGKRLH